eukprot:5803878-Pyramimonas_sp.AAC.1
MWGKTVVIPLWKYSCASRLRTLIAEIYLPIMALVKVASSGKYSALCCVRERKGNRGTNRWRSSALGRHSGRPFI